MRPNFASITEECCCVLHNFVRKRDGFVFEDTLSCELQSVQESAGDRGGTVVKVLCYKSESSIPASVSGFFIDTKSFRSHYGSGVDSASNRNEYQEHFLGVPTAGA